VRCACANAWRRVRSWLGWERKHGYVIASSGISTELAAANRFCHIYGTPAIIAA
jgi:hypothetical protein